MSASLQVSREESVELERDIDLLISCHCTLSHPSISRQFTALQTGEGFLLVFHFKHHLLPVGPYGHQGKASDALAEPLDIVVVIDVLCNCLRALGELLRSLFPCRAPVLQERPSHLRKPR